MFSPDVRIIVISGVGFFSGIASFVHGLSSFRLKRLIENTPTSKVEAAAVGLVEVRGKAEQFGAVLESP